MYPETMDCSWGRSGIQKEDEQYNRTNSDHGESEHKEFSKVEVKEEEATNGGKEVYHVAIRGRKDDCVTMPEAEAPDSANIQLRKTERKEA